MGRGRIDRSTRGWVSLDKLGLYSKNLLSALRVMEFHTGSPMECRL